MAEWKSFEIKIPGQSIFDGIKDALQALVTFLEVLKAVLETVKIFLIDFGNPIKALVEALLSLIETLFESLKQTGLYALFDIPDFSDPDFERLKGGYPGFLARWKGSLLDTLDSNRPQPVPGANQSGYVIFYVEDTSLFALLEKLKRLLGFFGGQYTQPRYAAPVGLQVFPVNDKRDPILAVSALFQSKPKALAIEWQLPSDKGFTAPNFKGMLASVAEEFTPPKFLIERTTVAGANPMTTLTTLKSMRDRKGEEIQVVTPVREPTGEPMLLFEKAVTIEQENDLGAILLLPGTYRFVDTTVEPGVRYYYRVRAFSGKLTLENGRAKISDPYRFMNPMGSDFMAKYVGEDLIMGQPSMIAVGMLPQSLPDYDVFTSLTRLFQVLFSLNFHWPLEKTDTFDSQGKPTGSTKPHHVGYGSIPRWVAGIVFDEFFPSTKIMPSEVDGSIDDFPWERWEVRLKSRELAVIVASAMFDNGGMATQFRDKMQAVMPPIATNKGTLANVTTLQQVIDSLPMPLKVSESAGFNPQTVLETYRSAFEDVQLRLNLKAIYQFISGFTMAGDPPNWIKVSLLNDIVPWSGQILYEIIAKIQSLVDAFNGVMAEIKNYIDLFERKIEVLENFILFIIAMLEDLESLSISARLLSVDAGSGGIPAWMQLIDTATGDVPQGGPQEYAAGVTLAYSVIDAKAFKEAFSLLFGG